MEGYNHLTAAIASRSELNIFRRYLQLRVRDLLYMQAELADLEDELVDLIREDKDSGDEDQSQFHRHYLLLRYAATGSPKSHQRLKTIEIRQKLKEYGEALLLYKSLHDLPAVHKPDLATLRKWFTLPTGGNNFLPGGPEGRIWDRINEEDLTSLASQDKEQDVLTTWIGTKFIPWFHNRFWRERKEKIFIPNIFDRDYREEPLHDYPMSMIANVVYAVSTLLSTLLPTASIFALNHFERLSIRLGLILLFTSLFGMSLVLVARPRRVDSFTAVAAFAAVQVVFVQNSYVALN